MSLTWLHNSFYVSSLSYDERDCQFNILIEPYTIKFVLLQKKDTVTHIIIIQHMLLRTL